MGRKVSWKKNTQKEKFHGKKILKKTKKRAKILEPKWVLYNAYEVLTITKYKRTIAYANMCSSINDYRIKF